MNNGCRCAHYNLNDYLPTLTAADQVAGEFERADRIAMLAHSMTVEHPTLPNMVAKTMAEMFVEQQQ